MLTEFFTVQNQFTRIFQTHTIKPLSKKIQFNFETPILTTHSNIAKKNNFHTKYYYSSFLNKPKQNSHFTTNTNKSDSCEELIKQADQDSSKGEYQKAFNTLLKGLEVARRNDDLPNRAKVLGKLAVCSQLQLKNPELTLKYAKLWSQEAMKLKDLDGFADAMVLQFLAACARKEKEIALNSLQEFESVAINLENDQNTKGARLGRLGLLWKAIGQKPKAIECFKSALALVLDEKNFQLGQNNDKNQDKNTQTKQIALDLLQELHQLQMDTQRIEQAVETNEKRLALLRDGGSKETLLSLLREHGYMLNLMNWYDQSQEIYNEALKLSVEIGKVEIETEILVKLGEILTGSNETVDKGIEYLERATELAKLIEDDQLKTKATELIGNTYYKNGNFTLCIKFLDNLVSSSKKNNSKFNQDLVSLNLGRSYLEIGEVEKARKLLHEVLQMSGENETQIPILDLQPNQIDLNYYNDDEETNSDFSPFSPSNPSFDNFPRNVRTETINFNAYLSLMRVEDRSGNYKLSSWYGQQALIISQRTTVDHICSCDDDDSKISHRGSTKIEILKELIPIYIKAEKFKLTINSIKDAIETMQNIKNPDTEWRNYIIKNAIDLIIRNNISKRKLNFFLNFAIKYAQNSNDFNMELFYLFLLQKYTPNSNNSRAKELLNKIQNIQMPKLSKFEFNFNLNEWSNWLSSLRN
ncbi:tetratricopeptide repeat protein [Anaeramoeba flamelloides]|uniref:Tetratricopeptide repeat protein 29 n=1 Tax=Anaeramoeba flamelloides TaxID=1746091 RepID=A0AAV7YDS8_9EUKA|nr:tetratricopeptide repeat protein [Anaeramoeba flamelloides]